jgi:CHAT domain-containing protein
VGGAGAQGREVEGPGALAQTKGARGVLATLWPVADASTGRFMQRLYRLHQEGRLTKAEALRRAQLEFLGQNAAAAQPAAGGEAERRPLGLSAAAERAAAPAAPDPARPYAHPTTGPRSS